MTFRSETRHLHHECGSPVCHRRIAMYYFACGQHRALLGWDLNIRLQTAWLERRWNQDGFERTRDEAFKAWGWTRREVTPQP